MWLKINKKFCGECEKNKNQKPNQLTMRKII
jgi:hypothetical protein